jgi:hypothetical protein
MVHGYNWLMLFILQIINLVDTNCSKIDFISIMLLEVQHISTNEVKSLGNNIKITPADHNKSMHGSKILVTT